MTWTQPVCEARFKMLFPDRVPTYLLVPDKDREPCCYCGTPTNIYVRLDPATVPFPREEP